MPSVLVTRLHMICLNCLVRIRKDNLDIQFVFCTVFVFIFTVFYIVLHMLRNINK